MNQVWQIQMDGVLVNGGSDAIQSTTWKLMIDDHQGILLNYDVSAASLKSSITSVFSSQTFLGGSAAGDILTTGASQVQVNKGTYTWRVTFQKHNSMANYRLETANTAVFMHSDGTCDSNENMKRACCGAQPQIATSPTHANAGPEWTRQERTQQV